MKTFLVGGAVRDELLSFPVSERDWVVLGETPESMLEMGFMTVGKDFPVFLHPVTRDEYALARTERKIGPGYKGFCIHADPEVSLEEDLMRRDLTINAIAKSDTGEIIDPFGGRQDIEQRVFRHISPAFCEDPVRILRIARFAARYGHLGFKIADETLQLMQTMVKNGEVDHLVPERVWAELYKALCEKTPVLFFEVLKACHALPILFPELNALFGVPQPEHYHPEIDTGIHSLLCLEQAARLTSKPEVRFAALMHDLGKGITPQYKLPHHHGHENSGLPLLENLCLRLRAPNPFKHLAKQVMQYHTHCHRAFELRPSTLTDMLHILGAFKNPIGLTDFLLACEADAKGRTGLENRPYPQAAHVMMAAKAGAAVDISALLAEGLQGAQIGDAIRQLRIKAISDACKRTS